MKNYYENINITHVFRCKQFVWIDMSQKPPVNDFEWKENIRKFNEDFENYDENSNEGNVLEVDV